jgi:hypothetical protein
MRFAHLRERGVKLRFRFFFIAAFALNATILNATPAGTLGLDEWQ